MTTHQLIGRLQHVRDHLSQLIDILENALRIDNDNHGHCRRQQAPEQREPVSCAGHQGMLDIPTSESRRYAMFPGAEKLLQPMIEKDDFGDLTIQPPVLDAVTLAKIDAEIAAIRARNQRTLSGLTRQNDETADTLDSK